MCAIPAEDGVRGLDLFLMETRSFMIDAAMARASKPG
jgi:hypothetical protein